MIAIIMSFFLVGLVSSSLYPIPSKILLEKILFNVK